MFDATKALSNLKSPPEIQSARAHLFPSDTSMQWYMRRHRRVLEKAGALLKINGRLVVDEIAFDNAVIEIARSRCTDR